MSGQSGARGYLLQTLICVLDGINDANNWQSVTIEPNDESEKTDILWDYGQRRKAVQVKSSQNQIDLASAKKWALELESSSHADELELRLIGPCSQAVAIVDQIGSVRVPTPEYINIGSLTEQAAHKLDRYLTTRQLPTLSPFAREILVEALSHRFGAYSTEGLAITRGDLDALLISWIAEFLPPAVPAPQCRSTNSDVRQIAAPPRDFVGREEEIEKLLVAVSSGARLIGIRGMPGVGKSAFAAKVVTLVAREFSGPHVELDLRGHTPRPLAVAEAMRIVIQAITPDRDLPTDLSALEGLYRSTLQGVDAILFFENVPSEQVLSALDPFSSSLVLFTTRQRFFVPNLLVVDLLPLSLDCATELLLSISPRLGDAALRVAELCGCLPLALRLAACSFAERPDIGSNEYVTRLSHECTILESVEASIQLSYDLLDDSIKQRFCTLCLFPLDFDVRAARAVFGIDQHTADSTIGSLLRSSMLEWDNDRGRYWMHELIHGFASARSDESFLADAKWRYCDFFRDICFQIEKLYKEGHESVCDALFAFDCERSNIEIAVNWLAWRSQDDSNAALMCVDYVSSTTFPRDLRQHPIERIRWLSMGFDAAQKIPDGISALSFLGNIGRAFADIGEIEQALAIHKQCLEAAKHFRLKPHECVAFLQIGNMQSLTGNYREAIESFAAARTIAVELKNRSLEAHALANSGNALAKLCDFEPAKDSFIKGAEIFGELGDQLNLAKVQVQSGEMAFSVGDHKCAIDILENVLGIANDIQDPLTLVQAGRTLGKAHTAAGHHELAIAILEENVGLAKRLSILRFVFAGLGALADAYEQGGMAQKADEVVAEYQIAAEVIGDQETVRDGRRTAARILEHRKKFREAIQIHEEMLADFRVSDQSNDEMRCLCKLSHLYELNGDMKQATTCLESAAEIAVRTQHPFGMQLTENASEKRRSLA